MPRLAATEAMAVATMLRRLADQLLVEARQEVSAVAYPHDGNWAAVIAAEVVAQACDYTLGFPTPTRPATLTANTAIRTAAVMRGRALDLERQAASLNGAPCP